MGFRATLNHNLRLGKCWKLYWATLIWFSFAVWLASSRRSFCSWGAWKKKINKKKRGEKRLRYGKQNYFRLPPCDVKLCTKICEKKKNKWSEAVLCLLCKTVVSEKVLCVFRFFFLPYYLSVLIWSYSQVNKSFHIVLITFPFSVWWFRRQKHVLPWCHV